MGPLRVRRVLCRFARHPAANLGFPVTVSVGLIGLLLTQPVMEAPFTMALERLLAQFQQRSTPFDLIQIALNQNGVSVPF